MVRTAIFGGLGTLGVLLIYRNFIADTVPDKVAVGTGNWAVSYDDIALAVGVALLAPTLTGFAHKVIPG